MKFRQFTNEKGMTLVELLAALSLFSVVIALSSTVIIQMVSGEEKINDNISLKQDANVIISEIRNQYNEKQDQMNNNIVNLCFGVNDGITKLEIMIDGHLVTINDGCFESDLNEDELPIKLTVSNSSESFTLETTLERKKNLNLEISNTYETGNIDKCKYTKHTIFHKGLEIQNASRKPCDEYIFLSSVDFLGNLYIHNHTEITVTGGVYIEKDLTIKPNTKLSVTGNLIVNGNLDIKGGLCVTGEFKDKERYSCN